MEKKTTLPVRLMSGLIRSQAALPLPVHYGWARVIAWFLRRVLRYRSDEVLTNLSRCFPEKKYAELKDIRDGFYRHFGEIVAEMVWFGGRRGERGCRKLRDAQLVRIVNMDTFNAFYDRCSSVMLLNSHAGNWELMGGFMEYGGDTPPHWTLEQVVVLYKRLHNRFWDRVVADNRCAPVAHRGYTGYVESADILRYAVAHRHDKRIYVFNTDQYPYGKAARCTVSFLDQPTQAMTGGASLACKLGMGVAYIQWRQAARGRYEMAFVPLMENAADHTPEEIMQTYYARLGEDIRQQPWNYLWSHKRWK